MFARMLAVVRRIPRGKVSTYGDIAYAAGFPGRARQVAWALHASHGLPWHRVVGSGGKLLMPGSTDSSSGSASRPKASASPGCA